MNSSSYDQVHQQLTVSEKGGLYLWSESNEPPLCGKNPPPSLHFSREEIAKKANLNVPSEFKNKYIDILYKHQAAISMNKLDLGRAKNFTHKIHLKDNNPVYRKQFKIPEAHQNFIEATLDEWLKLEKENVETNISIEIGKSFENSLKPVSEQEKKIDDKYK